MRKHITHPIVATLLAVVAQSFAARADIFQWEYINPGLGKKQSTTLCPGGAGANAVPAAQLAGRNLTKAYLIGADLSDYWLWDVEGGLFHIYADLMNVNLSQAELTSANLNGASLIGASLFDAEVRWANFFRDPDDGIGGITPAQLYSTASYKAHDLSGIRMEFNQLASVNLSGQNLSNSWLSGANMTNANLTQANLTNAGVASTLTNANLSQANLTGANLGAATLTGANFTGADVRGARFYYSQLSPMQLYSTASYLAQDLSGIKLHGSYAGLNLAGQKLTNAAFLFDTDLTGANFAGADTRGAYGINIGQLGNTANLIQADGHVAGLNLVAGTTLLIRDYDDNPSVPRVVVDQFMSIQTAGTLRLQFDADAWDSTISFAPGISVTRSGSLELAFAPDVSIATQIGRTIDLFDWNGVSPTGTFNVSSPYTWDISKLYTTGEVTLTAAPGIVPGDFNGTGPVDAADYVLWRKSIGTQAAYDTWRSHFGQSAGSGVVGYPLGGSAGHLSTVPEPTSLMLLACGVLLLVAGKSCKSRRDTTGLTSNYVSLPLSIVVAVVLPTVFARADIFQWEYINPATPSLGKQQSTTLTPDGAGAGVGIGTNLEYRNLTKAYLIGANLGYLFGSCDEGGCDFYVSYLTGANLTQADLSSAILAGAVLTDSNLTDAEVRGANFYHLLFGFGDGFGGLTLAQLYSTASYKAHDLSGINLGYNELASGNLTGQNLSNANFFAATLLNANLSAADARGANFQFATLTGATTTNLIQTNGHIAGLDLTSGASLLIRDYDGNSAASPPVGPLPIVVDGHLAMSGSGSLKLVFEQDAWNSTISFAPGIPVARGGRLELTFAPDVSLATQIGRTIDLFDWTGVLPTGTFNVSSPYTWDISKLYTTGEVTLTAAPGIVPGDFNGNGTVDAADYVVWRKGISVAPTQENYNSWRSRFGQPGGSGAGATDYTSPSAESLPTAVPEPASLLLLSMAGLALAMTRPIRANQVTIRAILRITYVSTAIALTCSAAASHADIFQWEYINPANPSLGKQPSTTLAPQGAGVDALPGASLFGRNLTKAYLVAADLSPLYDFESWTPADLRYANLSQADLKGANLFAACLVNTNLSQANLANAYLGGAPLNGANLTGAEIRWANFQETGLSQSQLISTASYANHDLTGVNLYEAKLSGIDLSAQNLLGASLFGVTLSGANLSQANLTTTQLGAIDARAANFSQANLTYANLVGADLRGANMLGATLTGVNTSSWIQSNGHVAGLNLTASGRLTIRDYDGNPDASPPTGPLPIVIDQRFLTGTSSSLVMKFDADAWNSTISFAPGIPVSRGGTLWLTFESGANLAGQIGRTIDLFDWTGVSPTGIFTVYSDDDYTWDLSKLYTTGEVKLVSVPGIWPGDFNYDGIVDAADYVVWRETDGSDVGYNAWRANFGTTLGSGSSQFADLPLSSAIPEPTSALLCLSFAAIRVWGHRRRFHRQQ